MYIWLSRRKGHRGSADAPQGCEVRRWLPQSSSVSAGCHGICSADAPQGCKPALDQAFKALQSSADALQGCKLALDQEVLYQAAQYQPYLSIETGLHIQGSTGLC